MADTEDFPFGIMDVASLLRLNIRRRQQSSIYADCPFCGDKRGKMNINHVKNVWRCNYCGEGGGMVTLYAKAYSISNSDAYREICDALQTGNYALPGYEVTTALPGQSGVAKMAQAERADIYEIHQTFSLLLGMLNLSAPHRKKLGERGLTDEQIDHFGYKSTPPPYLCISYTERLMKQGCTVQGVPGFYLNDDGKWTVKFHKRTAGILIPAKGIDGLIRGAQIRLDVPIKDKDDLEKEGTKYLWLSSSDKNMGVTSGSPVHYVGDPLARTVYVTEGILKADIAHCLMNRSFAAIAGVNNTSSLGPLFALLAHNGTQLIMEAVDMDKYRNKHVTKGMSKIYSMAREYKMDCKRLTWNPNYKGVDDWQLALKKKTEMEVYRMNFKERFLSGECGIDAIGEYIERQHTASEDEVGLAAYLGLTEGEYETYVHEGGAALQKLLLSKYKEQKFRIYQLEFGENLQAKPFAFEGIKALHKAGYEQPPAAEYRLVHDGMLLCGVEMDDNAVMERIFCRYNDNLPANYHGRSVSPSDVIELYEEGKRLYFYCDRTGFVPVRFSPALAKPMKQ